MQEIPNQWQRRILAQAERFAQENRDSPKVQSDWARCCPAAVRTLFLAIRAQTHADGRGESTNDTVGDTAGGDRGGGPDASLLFPPPAPVTLQDLSPVLRAMLDSACWTLWEPAPPPQEATAARTLERQQARCTMCSAPAWGNDCWKCFFTKRVARVWGQSVDLDAMAQARAAGVSWDEYPARSGMAAGQTTSLLAVMAWRRARDEYGVGSETEQQVWHWESDDQLAYLLEPWPRPESPIGQDRPLAPIATRSSPGTTDPAP